MRKYKSITLITAILLSLTYFSCDDSGLTPSNLQAGLITLRQKNLKHLDPNVEGAYQLWIRLDTLGDFSLGKFNIGSLGEITDTNGAAMQFTFSGDTTKLHQVIAAYISVEPPNDPDPWPSVAILLSGQTVVSKDSVYGTMTIGGSMALGSAGQELLYGANAGFSIAAPTAGYSFCWEGVWFCDTTAANNTSFPPNIQLTGAGWHYQGWVVDNTNPGSPKYYNMGRFTNPYGPDFDGAGPCAGTLPPYQRPGQDWIRGVCPTNVPQISELNKAYYGVFVTIEPSYEVPNGPAHQKPFLKIYENAALPQWVHCGTKAVLASKYGLFPRCEIRITR